MMKETEKFLDAIEYDGIGGARRTLRQINASGISTKEILLDCKDDLFFHVDRRCRSVLRWLVRLSKKNHVDVREILFSDDNSLLNLSCNNDHKSLEYMLKMSIRLGVSLKDQIERDHYRTLAWACSHGSIKTLRTIIEISKKNLDDDSFIEELSYEGFDSLFNCAIKKRKDKFCFLKEELLLVGINVETLEFEDGLIIISDDSLFYCEYDPNGDGRSYILGSPTDEEKDRFLEKAILFHKKGNAFTSFLDYWFESGE